MHPFTETRENQVTLCSGQILQQMTTFIILSIRTLKISVAMLISPHFQKNCKTFREMNSKKKQENTRKTNEEDQECDEEKCKERQGNTIN